MGKKYLADLEGPRGLSAYEVAVKNGFVGTEPEWLASLASGGLLDPVTGLPPENVVTALGDAITEDYDEYLLEAYRIGKI